MVLLVAAVLCEAVSADETCDVINVFMVEKSLTVVESMIYLYIINIYIYKSIRDGTFSQVKRKKGIQKKHGRDDERAFCLFIFATV